MVRLHIHTILRALAAPAARVARGKIWFVRQQAFPEADITVYPVAHFPLPHALKLLRHLRPVLLPFWNADLQDWSRLKATPGKPDHLAVVCAAWVWAACRVVVEDVFVRHIGGVGEEDLGV